MPLSRADDQELLTAVRSGDEAALRELLARHASSVFRFATKMCGNRDDAQDVAQETLLAAVRGAKDLRGAASFSTWLYAVARSFCIKMRRRRKHEPREHASLDDALAETAGGVTAPYEDAAARELAAALDSAVGALEEKYREVILLRDVEGLSASEVAEVLGISVDAVKSRLHRARSAVRAHLAPLIPAPGVSTAVGPCIDIATTFSRYLEGEIGPDQCAAMQRHVDGCTSCSAVCEGLRRTVSLCQQAGATTLSDELQERVRSALEAALRAGRSTTESQDRGTKS
jgi:RNA polymerase sigma-70 factor (ECF subfamily)